MPLTAEEIAAAESATSTEPKGADTGDEGDEEEDDEDEGDEGDEGAEGAAGGEGDKPKTPTAFEAAVAVAAEKRAKILADESRAQEARDAAEARQARAVLDSIETGRANLVTRIGAVSVDGFDAHGQATKFQVPAAVVQQIVDEIIDGDGGIKSGARGPIIASIMEDIRDAAVTALPDDASRKQFTEVVAELAKKGTPNFVEWLKGHNEAAAAGTSYVKKLLVAHEADKVAEYGKGWDEGQAAPLGTGPSQSNSTVSSRRKTFEQLEAGYGDGSNTKAQDDDYLRLKDERQKA